MPDEESCRLCSGPTRLFRESTLRPESLESSEVFSYEGHWFGKQQPMGRLWQCAECGFVFAELPDNLSTSDYEDVVDPFYLRTEAGRREICQQDLNALEHWHTPGSLLDIGCGSGLFIGVAQEAGWKTQGIEPSRWAGDLGRQSGLSIHTGEFHAGTFPDEQFDAVTMWSVLEHVPSPVKTIKEVWRILKPNGVLGVVVPNLNGLYARLFPARMFIRMHVSYFTTATLSLAATQARFQVAQVDIP